MKCIFCKADSSSSKSVEHIIPESLGNKSHVLQRGIVCDSCNNYLAIKVEKEVLEMAYFKSVRGRNQIENKKGRTPGIPGFIKDKNKIEVSVFPNDSNILEVVIEDKKLFKSIRNHNKLYIPILPEPPKDNLLISKFIGKVAIEALALRVASIDNWQEEFISNESLDELRGFVRYGKGYKIWPYHTRRIYHENQINFDEESKTPYEILHEFDFLLPDKPIVNGELNQLNNLYFVMAIMGIEYTINITNAGLGRYIEWLSVNQDKSILLMDKSEFNQ